jgi:hypothetical protein
VAADAPMIVGPNIPPSTEQANTMAGAITSERRLAAKVGPPQQQYRRDGHEYETGEESRPLLDGQPIGLGAEIRPGRARDARWPWRDGRPLPFPVLRACGRAHRSAA